MIADYGLATERAYDFLLTEDFYYFPLNLKRYAKKKYILITYTEAAKLLNVSRFKVEKCVKGSWGVTLYKDSKYIIMYDDKLDIGAQLFTIAHEIGHIEMGHFTNVKFKNAITRLNSYGIINASNNLYTTMDNEADCFARNILCPVRILEHANHNFTIEFITSFFGITEKAASARLDFWGSDLYHSQCVCKDLIVKKYLSTLQCIHNICDCDMSDLYIHHKQQHNKELLMHGDVVDINFLLNYT